MNTYDHAKTEVDARMTFSTGWGVSVALIHYGENDEGINEESVSYLEVGVTRIAADTVKMIGNVLCVPFNDEQPHSNMWVPVQSYLPNLPTANDDSHDARDHWFATEAEAREHAEMVLSEWATPQPWQAFIQTD